MGVGDERTRVAAGEAVLWPADVTHTAWTEHSEMRAFVIEFMGADDSGVEAFLEGRAIEIAASTAARAVGELADHPSDRPTDPGSGEPS